MLKVIRIWAAALFVLSAAAVASPQDRGGADARARELLRQARLALGGETKLAGVRGLSVAAVFRRATAGDDFVMSGEVELDLLFPDKFMKAETLSGLGGDGPTLVRALNGEQEWADVRSNGPGVFMVRRGEGGDDGEAAAERLEELRHEFARYAIALLLTPPGSVAVEWVYAGEAEAEDGRADVLDAKGGGGFALRLFLDQRTHLPLMASYTAKMPTVEGVAMKDGPRHGALVMRAPAPASEGELKGEGPAGVKVAPPEMKEVQVELRLSDYREAGGLLLPYRIQQSLGGEASEEWEIKKYKLNPSLKPERFRKR